MYKAIFCLSLALILTTAGMAQKGAGLGSSAQIAAQLQSSLDVRNAQVGDEVVLKTTRAIKQNGQVVIEKGSRLIGHVTEVKEQTKGNASSRIGILFDTLQQGGNSIPINAMITSITQANAQSRMNDDVYGDMSGSSSTRTSSSSSSSSGGGLLGGVGNTVGGVVNTTTQTVGGVVNTTGQTVGTVTNTAGQTVGGTLRGIQISNSTSASASGSSTLSLAGGNLRLEKGTTFNLNVTKSASANNN